ncbi:MAG: glycosyltransferase [Candidatus Omnitrophota bacterium]
MISILRPIRETSLISANVFESLFIKSLEDILDIVTAPLVEFGDAVLGPWDQPFTYGKAAERFYFVTRGYDFFCPGYECIALAPLFLELRNTSRADIRLLLIAHSAGLYAMEWALLRPLLVPGDLIIAPSMSAKNAILWLCPELAKFVTVIHHPIPFLPRKDLAENENDEKHEIKLVTLSRIEQSKLIHRQIEAVGLLVNRGFNTIRMSIAGSLEDPLTGEPTVYSRSLRAKIKRMKLEKHVFLVGLIRGEEAKAHFLKGARVALNLSNSCEEAFPKASVEPLGMGIPVIACAWDGYVETVGDCGKLIPLTEIAEGFLDVMPEHIAEAIIELLEHPIPADQCIAHAERFLPSVAREKYVTALSRAMKSHPQTEITRDSILEYDGGITDTEGLIGKIACLTPFSWKEIMTFHWEYSKKIRAGWLDVSPDASAGDYEESLRNMIIASIYKPLSYFYAGKIRQKDLNAINLEKMAPHTDSAKKSYQQTGDFWEAIAEAVNSPSIMSSKTACLYEINKNNAVDLLERSLNTMGTESIPLTLVFYYKSKMYSGKNNYEKAYEACVQAIESNELTALHSSLLRELASVCRRWKKPEAALPWLERWLDKFPDEPDSGLVWLEYAYNCFYSDDKREESSSILDNAKKLLGDLQPIRELEYIIRLFRLFA